MKKFVYLIVVSSLLMTITGCQAPAPAATQPPPTVAPTKAPQVVTLRVSNWHLAEPHWEKTIKAAIPLFEKENPDIKVNLEVVSYAEKEAKYATEIQAGAGPDLIHLAGYSIRNFVESGYLLDVTPFIQKEPAGFLDQWYPHLVELFKYQDKQYGLPSDYMAMILAYDKKLFTEAGLDPNKPPKTWDEFLDYAKKMTRDRKGSGKIDTWGFGTVGTIDPGWELRFSPVLLTHGAAYVTPDNKCSALNTPEAKEAFKFWVGLVTDAKVVPPGVTSQGAGAVPAPMLFVCVVYPAALASSVYAGDGDAAGAKVRGSAEYVASDGTAVGSVSE